MFATKKSREPRGKKVPIFYVSTKEFSFFFYVIGLL